MNLLLMYAIALVGTPYKWGGKEPVGGLDCSGLVQILLKSAGEDIPGDQNAQAYFDHFHTKGEWNRHECGSLIFFGQSATRVTHVGMMLDQYRFIEAAGGDSTTLTVDDAKARRAFVRISHINSRKDRVAVIKPYYRLIGCI